MRVGDLIWKQVIELRSRNHASQRDDERLAAIFRWTLPYYYGWQQPKISRMSCKAPANS